MHVLAATTLLHRYDIKPKRYADRNRPGSGSFSTCVVLSGHVGSSFIIFSSIYSILTSIPRSAFGRKIRFNCSRQTCCVNEMCLLFPVTNVIMPCIPSQHNSTHLRILLALHLPWRMEAVKGFLPRALPQRTFPVLSRSQSHRTSPLPALSAHGSALALAVGWRRRRGLMGLRNSKEAAVAPPKKVEGETLVELGQQTLEAISRFTKSIPEKGVFWSQFRVLSQSHVTIINISKDLNSQTTLKHFRLRSAVVYIIRQFTLNLCRRFIVILLLAY